MVLTGAVVDTLDGDARKGNAHLDRPAGASDALRGCYDRIHELDRLLDVFAGGLEPFDDRSSPFVRHSTRSLLSLRDRLFGTSDCTLDPLTHGIDYVVYLLRINVHPAFSGPKAVAHPVALDSKTLE
jgi:hypothetical protein